jgi:hypothetical protein
VASLWVPGVVAHNARDKTRDTLSYVFYSSNCDAQGLQLELSGMRCDVSHQHMVHNDDVVGISQQVLLSLRSFSSNAVSLAHSNNNSVISCRGCIGCTECFVGICHAVSQDVKILDSCLSGMVSLLLVGGYCTSVMAIQQC